MIPISFELGGSTYNVEVTNNRPEGIKGTTTGAIIYPINKVLIFDNHTGYICTDSYNELSFYHELTHGILSTIGRSELNDDEEFVEAFASVLHQYNKTVKYESKSN